MDPPTFAMESTTSQQNIPEHIESVLRILRTQINTLLDCPKQFNGDYGVEKINRFINYIESYKEAKNISDEQSLRELPHLLHGPAYMWWCNRGNEITSWQAALERLRLQFSQVRPAYSIYRDIFGIQYETSQSVEQFLYDKFELFAQLPQPQPKESVQLDMIFGMLPEAQLKHIKRNEVTNLVELIEKVKSITQEEKTQEDDVERVPDVTVAVPNSNYESSDEERKDHSNILMEEPEREPIIKVRRTEDLMPQIKDELEKCVQDFNDEHKEKTGHHFEREPNSEMNTPHEFHIDSELMNQINNIIEDCDMEAASLLQSKENQICENPDSVNSINVQVSQLQMPITSITNENSPEPPNPPNLMSPPHPPPIELQQSENNETPADMNILPAVENIVALTSLCVSNSISTLNTTTSNIIDAKKNRSRARCSYCRHNGHTVQDCLKKKRKREGARSALVAIAPQSTENSIMPNQNISSIVTSINFVGETTTTTTSKYATPISSAVEGHNILTTKLISPAEVPSTGKTIASKLRNVTSPSLKCHQCGTVGYYRSICPNCSPIYFYKPSLSSNR